MNPPNRPNPPNPPDRHTDVGAYALGVLDPEDAARFEEHLAGCGRCAVELEELLGLGSVLREIGDGTTDAAGAEAGAAAGAGAGAESAAAGVVAAVTGPRPQLLDRLLADTGRRRRTERRRRRLLAVAAAAAVIAGGAVVVPRVAGDDGPVSPAAAVQALYQQGQKFHAVDPATGVDATVSLRDKAWGTQVALRLAKLKGPRTCDLVAVGKDGERQTVTSWTVPPYGYGIEGTEWAEPLLVDGGSALPRERIDHFEVRTHDGERLVSIAL